MKKIMTVLLLCLVIAAAINSIGCRERSLGTPGSEPTATNTRTATPTFTATNPPQVITDPLIDSFVDGDGTNNYGGPWFTYCDGVNTVILQANAVQAPGYGGVDYAYHMTGTAAVSCGYGAWAATALLSGAKANVSAFTGIRFQAMTGQAGSTYRLVMLSGATTNNFQYTFTPSTSWSQVSVPFASFTQAAADYEIVTIGQATGNITHVDFANGSCSETLDLWLDNLEFY